MHYNFSFAFNMIKVRSQFSNYPFYKVYLCFENIFIECLFFALGNNFSSHAFCSLFRLYAQQDDCFEKDLPEPRLWFWS